MQVLSKEDGSRTDEVCVLLEASFRVLNQNGQETEGQCALEAK